MRIGIIGFGGVSKAFIKLLNKKRNDVNIIFVLKSNGGLYNFRSLEIAHTGLKSYRPS